MSILKFILFQLFVVVCLFLLYYLAERKVRAMNDNEQKIIFAKNLNKLLSDAGKTQREVADAIHVLPTTFNTWCQGVALPRMGKVQLLADYFGVKKSDLIEPPAPSPAQDALTDDERILVRGYRAASSDRREDMLDLARKALKSKEGVTSSSSRGVGEETA